MPSLLQSHKSLFMLGLLLLATACKKESTTPKEVNYWGTFTVTYATETRIGTTALNLKDGGFRSSGNPDRFPAGGSGTYSYDDNTISFADTNFWTADFDANLVLNGDYDYVVDGRKLVFKKETSLGLYEYKMEW